jgi:hypothetical protein
MTERALEAGDPGEQPALGASRPGQPSRQSVSPILMVGWPRLASGAGDGEAHSSQTLPGGEIGDLESRIDHPGPQVPWHLLIRWDARFGELPVPLGPNRGLVAGKIQSLDGRAALPTTVRWREPSSDRVGSVHHVAPPSTLPDGDRVDVEGHSQAAPGSSRLEMRRATRA